MQKLEKQENYISFYLNGKLNIQAVLITGAINGNISYAL